MSVRIQEEDFDVGLEQRTMAAGNSQIGAIVSFTGIVRANSDGENLSLMTLEHYPGMTEKELERIEKEARTRWALTDCLIVHRVGVLKPGDNIVLVVTAASHRQAAFEAAQFLMDYLKTNAPFWKKEQTSDGGAQWVSERSSDNEAVGKWTPPADPQKNDAAE